MKIKKIIKSKNKLLKLKLINTKIYNKKHYKNSIKIEDISYRLKKSLYVIYKYSFFNKKILFLGIPKNISLKLQILLKDKTKHVFIPKSAWAKGSISNKKACFKHLSKPGKIKSNSFSKDLFKLKQNIDLVVVFDEPNNLEMINESYISKIPVISINSDLEIRSNKPTYKIPGNFKFNNKKVRDNIFYSILITALKKSIALRKKKNDSKKAK